MKRLQKTAFPMITAMLLAGHLYAQPAGTVDLDANAKVTVKAGPVLSPEDMKKQAQDLRNQVRADIQHVQALQAKARKEKDIIKLTCVNDKFIKLKAEANIFDLAHRELDRRARHDRRWMELGQVPASAVFARVTVGASDVRKVREEADTCIGEQNLGKESENDFSGPEIVDDPTLGLPFDIDVEPPAFASPYT